jgi:subtilisin family serine protease
MSDSKKLDYNLLEALRAFEESGAQHDAGAGITVSLRFEGDLSAIEELGFKTFAVSGNKARGIVWFKDIPALVAHSGVRWLAVGEEREVDTDTAVKDIRARADTSGHIGPLGNGLWHVDDVTGTLSKDTDTTGAGVIVAVIDTGIDYTHPAFMSQLTPTKKSRILKIWDQGLVATAAADSPGAALLGSNPLTYGVEYDNISPNTEIDTALNGGASLLHKDCSGHGTHVAAIAAGGTKFPSSGDAEKVGVALEADIIAVKLLDVPKEIRYGTATAHGVPVYPSQRFHDAILYCLRTARALAKPIVINMSFGSIWEPGDGLDDDAEFIDDLMNPAHSADDTHFPSGAVIVKSAGNSGRASRRQTAKFTIPAGGLTVPIELKDTRSGLGDKWKTELSPGSGCARRTHAPALGVIFWYRRTTPATAVKFAVRLPHQTTFSADQEVGGRFHTSFRVSPPWPFTTTLHPVATNRHTVDLYHEDNPPEIRPAGTVRRQRVRMLLKPKQVGTNVFYISGIYEVKITAPAGTEVYAMCLRQGWDPGKGVTCEIATQMQNGSAPAPEVAAGLTSDSSAVDTLGKYAITVAAYNDTDGVSGHVDHHAIADFSSRGPLRDFSDPSGSIPPIATKPNIAAPGVQINAAASAGSQPTTMPRTAAWHSGIRFTHKGGTSMSAPMVTGVVALMLNKKNNLNTIEVLAVLETAAVGRPGTRPAAPPSAVTNAYGNGMVDALTSHTNTS